MQNDLMRTGLRISRSRRGGNAIEFALLFPIFVFLFAGLVDYGWWFMVQSVATNAVHEAVRAGAVTLVVDDPVGAATAEVTNQLNTSGVTLPAPTIDAQIGGAAPNSWIKVSIELALTPPVGLVPIPSLLTATAVMRLEDQSG